MGDNVVDDDEMALASKPEPDCDGTPSSIESTPEREDAEPSQEPAQPQKRKGGRKPIYATSEERKQRNRQAQAAFRERRTEYIKQLEATIKQNDETLTSLQQSHRTAADECLMLRYKNSLLERILLEKGIDVQAELQMKTGSPILGHGFMHAAGLPQAQHHPSHLQRTALQRQQARRSGGQNFLPKLAPGQPGAEGGFATSSPGAHPTPSSHASSPTQMSTRSPMATYQGGMTPPGSIAHGQPQTHQFQGVPRSSQPPPNQAFYQAQQQIPGTQRQTQRPPSHSGYQSSASGMSSHSVSSRKSAAQPMPGSSGSQGAGPAPPAASFYPSPFQKHFEQLEQEYGSMLDGQEPELQSSGPSTNELQGTYPPQFEHQQAHPQANFYQDPTGMPAGRQHGPLSSQHEQSHMLPPTSHPGAQDGPFDVDPNDPNLDADPFGLSASMHYTTAYSFDQHQGQR